MTSLEIEINRIRRQLITLLGMTKEEANLVLLREAYKYIPYGATLAACCK